MRQRCAHFEKEKKQRNLLGGGLAPRGGGPRPRGGGPRPRGGGPRPRGGGPRGGGPLPRGGGGLLMLSSISILGFLENPSENK